MGKKTYTLNTIRNDEFVTKQYRKCLKIIENTTKK